MTVVDSQSGLYLLVHSAYKRSRLIALETYRPEAYKSINLVRIER
jgi:hypothetical protein